MQTIKNDGYTVHILTAPHEARKFVSKLQDLDYDSHLALDFETTALRPTDSDDARVRLTSLSFADKTAYVIDHDLCGSFASFCDDLAEAGPYYVFNANFEGRWFEYEISAVTGLTRLLYDVAHMRRAVMGGNQYRLDEVVKRDLKCEMDKSLQNSDWSAPKLSNKQYFYSGLDSIYTRDLAIHWSSEMTSDHWNGFHIINDAWRAVNETEDTGLLLDLPYHSGLIRMWERRRKAAEHSLRRYIGEDRLPNIRSKKRISDLFKEILDDEAIENWPKTEKTAQLQTDRKTLRSMSFIAPYPLSRVMAALMVYNRADKYIGTYGETLQTKQRLSATGRIHSRLNMAAAITGRFSSSGPNQQNFPHHPAFRQAFIAEPRYVLIIADYSGVEIRVLAELSGDEILLHDTIYDNVHARSAIAIYGIEDADEFMRKIKKGDPQAKEMRSKAKAFTFQLLYGAGAGALAIVLRCSVDEAQDAINKWAARYRKAYHYRTMVFEKMKHSGFIDCASGRTIFVHRNDRTMPVAANYGVQGSAGDVMYAAMTETQKILDERNIEATLMASVHDEMLLNSKDYCAEEARQALQDGMVLGWLKIFPDTNTDNLVEAAIGLRWSDKS